MDRTVLRRRQAAIPAPRNSPAASATGPIRGPAVDPFGLPPGSCLETHRGIRMPMTPARRHAGIQDGIATVIVQGPEPAVQDHAVLPVPRTPAGQRIPRKRPPELVEGFDSLEGRCFGRMASGVFRYLRTVLRAMPSSPAIPRMERPAPFISLISFTSSTFSKVCRAPPRRLRE